MTLNLPHQPKHNNHPIPGGIPDYSVTVHHHSEYQQKINYLYEGGSCTITVKTDQSTARSSYLPNDDYCLNCLPMKLSHVKGWEGEDQLITDRPTEALISEFVHSLDWNDFNAVHLAKDDQNWINVSGNISPDGLSIVYEENGEQHVADKAPLSIQELVDIVLSYFIGDQKFKEFGFDALEHKRYSEDDQRWLDEYERKQSRQIKLGKKGTILTIIFALLFSTYLYLAYTGEIKFIGRETEQTIANVTETKWRPRRPQIVFYEFSYQGHTYTGHFSRRLKKRVHQPQDRVRIKFLVNDPSTSKWLATLKRTP